jgi:hypothetical protein
VQDDGTPILFDEEVITVTVDEINLGPMMAPIGDKTIAELATLNFTATANDPDLPANALAYSLIGEPVGAMIDPTTGHFSWTPTEAQGPGSYTFTVRVSDDGTPILFDEEQITVTVNEHDDVLTVVANVTPGSINLARRGVVSVVLFTTNEFEASRVDVSGRWIFGL